jgi:hypothetical protein
MKSWPKSRVKDKTGSPTRAELIYGTCLVACARTTAPSPAAPREVPIPSATEASEPEAPPTRAPASCSILGDGASTGDPWVQVYGDEALTEPWIDIDTAKGLVFDWKFEPDESRPSFQVAVERQESARVSGWAKRPTFRFWFRRDTALVDQRVFARKGDTVDSVVGRDGDQLRVQQGTTLSSPKTIDATTSCRGLRWGWVAPDGALAHGKRSHGVPGRQLLLFAEAGVGQPIRLDFGSDEDLVYEVEQSGDWVKINFTAGPFFQGWVKEDSVGPTPPFRGKLGSSHRTRSPRHRVPKRLEKIGIVARDTALYVAMSSQSPREIGVLERGAVVRIGATKGRLNAIQFDNGYLRAPSGADLCADAADIENVREQERGGIWNPPPVAPRNEEEAD